MCDTGNSLYWSYTDILLNSGQNNFIRLDVRRNFQQITIV